MRTRDILLTAIPAILLLAGCASSDEWTTWKSHSTHFASGDHMSFSMKTSEAAPQVTRRDVALARDEGWWGKPITIAEGQILER
jgi:hypothetical protein